MYIDIYIMSKLATDKATVAISTERKNNIKSHRCLNLLAVSIKTKTPHGLQPKL